MPASPYVRKAVASAFAVALSLSLSPAVAQADPGGQSISPPGEQRYIVKYDNDANAVEESKSLEEGGVEVKNTLSHSMKASVVVADAAEIESIKMADNVASVEPDSRVSVSSPTSLWGMDRIDQRTGRDGHYGMTDEGQGVDVYVVDSGLNLSHQDFSGRIPAGWDGIKDGIGLHDCRGHGTHVAGTIAGTASGAATRANIIPVRVIDCDGRGWASIVMAGIDWAIAHHPAGRPAVMNISLGNFSSSTMEQ
ncbi:MAG TPA: S8 family serine peptidase, partial [Arthrobacter sp.]